MDKNNVLNKLYFDPSGFQSQQRLYKEAKQKDNTITMNDVKEWYSQNVEKNKILWNEKLIRCTSC